MAAPKRTTKPKGKPKASQDLAVEVQLDQVEKQPRPAFRQFSGYAQAYPEAESFKNKLEPDYYATYLIFPVDPEKQLLHLPGAYLWASVDSYSPGTLDAEKPHYWVGVFDGHGNSMRHWFYSEVEATDSLNEIAILMPASFRELEQVGYRQE